MKIFDTWWRIDHRHRPSLFLAIDPFACYTYMNFRSTRLVGVGWRHNGTSTNQRWRLCARPGRLIGSKTDRSQSGLAKLRCAKLALNNKRLISISYYSAILFSYDGYVWIPSSRNSIFELIVLCDCGFFFVLYICICVNVI